MFDLHGYIADRAARAGVAGFEDLGLDTYADEARFFSYRRATHRKEPDYGRLVAAIALGVSAARRASVDKLGAARISVERADEPAQSPKPAGKDRACWPGGWRGACRVSDSITAGSCWRSSSPSPRHRRRDGPARRADPAARTPGFGWSAEAHLRRGGAADLLSTD